MFKTKRHQLHILNRALWTALALTLSSWGLSPAVGAQERSISATSSQSETLYLNNDRTYAYNLVAAERGAIDGIAIPAGATIVGKYVPAQGGLRYLAEAVTYDSYSYRISASSPVLEDVKDPRDISLGAIAEDAAIGAAGGTIIGEVFGDADVGEILGGAAAGAAVGNITADRVVVIAPNAPIVLYDD
ncbi:MAG: hypothetical protein ACFB4I_13520 [Cyanophyceae cyanobacterium]